MMEILRSRISKIFAKKLQKQTLDEATIKAVTTEIRTALLEADVNFKVVKEFIKNVREKALGEFLGKKMKAEKFIIKIVHDELVETLGGTTSELNLNSKITKIMMVGLQGSGKTTSCAKIANYLQKKHKKKSLLVAADVYRPAAIDQLEQLAKQLNNDFFSEGQSDPVKISENAVLHAKKNQNDVVIIDTAGRLHIDDDLMDELKKIKQAVRPNEILLVVDAMTGQDIINVSEAFNKALGLTGVIITKLDSDARGGATLSIRHLTKLPVKFIGTGERIGSLDLFHPERMASRILGMGDVVSLVEKLQDNVDENKMRKSFTRMMAGKFDLEDLWQQTLQIKKMGNVGGILKMLPNAQKITEEQEQNAQEQLLKMEYLLTSMTTKERRNPKLLYQHTRKQRILKGSGRPPQEYNQLLKKWEAMRKQYVEVGKKLKRGQNPFGQQFGSGF